ncbi:MAG: 1,4-alpha-glucan branching protein domain-containing protein [Chthoniobacterales bacterium]
MNAPSLGQLSLLLHAHLPFVRHPEHEDFLEEDWLFEAVTESYLPLLRVMRRLAADGVPFRLTMSLTPPLCAMLRDELLQQRYLRYLERAIALARHEVERNRHHAQLSGLAQFYLRFFSEARTFYEETLARDLVRAFRELQDDGFLEIIASAATHAFLPALQNFPEAQRAQIRIGCDSYRESFGRESTGFWLPECGYSDGLDSLLQEANIRWFVVDTHGLMFAEPRPLFAFFAPCYTPAGPAVFARDRESSQEVWSAESGYPGDPAYRDFYRDIGYDLPVEALRPFVRPIGTRKFSGIKYHRVSSATEEKQFYDPATANERAETHAEDFYNKRRARFREVAASGFTPIVLAPFDAELFGHWWFEGPHFLETLLRRVTRGPQDLRLATPGQFLGAHPAQQIVRPSPSSWGENGFSGVWLNENNAWIYPLLHSATRRMIDLARDHRTTSDPLVERALRQAARELLLAQSSDWAFLLKTRTAPEYARARTRDHLRRFAGLDEQLRAKQIDEVSLAECEDRAPIFPHLDWRYYL